MPIVKVGNEYVRFEEGTPQAVIDRVVKQAGGDPRTAALVSGVDAPAPQQKPKMSKRAQERAASRMMPTMVMPGVPKAIFDQVAGGALFNFNDEIEGAGNAITRGLVNAVRKRDIGEIGREYYSARDAAREDQADYASQNKGTALAASLIGSLMSPSSALGLAKAPAMVQGAAQGAAYAGASAAGQAKELRDVPRAVGSSVAPGAIFGGMVGGATQLARAGKAALKSQSGDEAANVAYERVSKALEDSPRYRGSNLRHTPESAAREIAVARGRGVKDAALMDLSPEMQTLSGFIKRKPATGVQNDLYEFGAQRMESRNNAFDDQVKELITPPTGQNALARMDQLKGQHRQIGASYDKLVTDNAPVQWSQELDDLAFSDNPIMRGAIQDAFRRVKGKDLKPTETGFLLSPEGRLEGISEKPTWRTFDLIRRSLGTKEQRLRKAGDFDGARDVANKYHELRDALGRANPDYTDMLSAQRSIFEQEAGVDFGKKVISRIGREPQLISKEIGELKPDQLADARTGFVSEVLNVRNKGNRSPINTFKAMLENPDQREVLAKLFGDSKNVNRFEKFLRRQARAAMSDSMVAGKQSITSDIALMSDASQTPTQELVSSGLHGFGYGGIVGSSGNVIRLLSRFSKHMSDKSLAELGRILMGDASDLASGIAKSKAAKAARKASDIQAVRNMSKLSGYETGRQLGN